jgi:hypothetical protein
MFMAFGAFFAGFGGQLEIGVASKMGPGYFPTALGIIVTFLGLIISAASLSSKAGKSKVEKIGLRTLLLIFGSIVLFGLLLKPLGLIVTLLVLITVSSYASHEFSLKATLINAAVLIALCLVMFVWGINLQFQIWPFFIGS